MAGLKLSCSVTGTDADAKLLTCNNLGDALLLKVYYFAFYVSFAYAATPPTLTGFGNYLL